jgi:UBX domain-containing protein 1
MGTLKDLTSSGPPPMPGGVGRGDDDDDDDDDEGEDREGESWFAGGERRCAILRYLWLIYTRC